MFWGCCCRMMLRLYWSEGGQRQFVEFRNKVYSFINTRVWKSSSWAYCRGWCIDLCHRASMALDVVMFVERSMVQLDDNQSWIIPSFIIIKQYSNYCCGISDDVQTVSKLTNSRNNCTNTNHTGSIKHLLMGYCTTATFLSHGSTKEVIPSYHSLGLCQWSWHHVSP